MGSGNESEILMLTSSLLSFFRILTPYMLKHPNYFYCRDVPIDKSAFYFSAATWLQNWPWADPIEIALRAFTKCPVEFKFLATVLRICLALAAGALIIQAMSILGILRTLPLSIRPFTRLVTYWENLYPATFPGNKRWGTPTFMLINSTELNCRGRFHRS